MPDYWWVGLGVALFVGGAILSLAWPRMAPYVPKQQEDRIAAIVDEDGTAAFTGGPVNDGAVVLRAQWKQDDWWIQASSHTTPAIGRAEVPLPLARLRDTGGYVGHIHRDCLMARRDGGEICPECLPRFQPRVGAS